MGGILMNTKEKTIFVTGATGHQGGAAAHHLLDHGFKVLALTRDPTKPAARDLELRGAELVKGNLERPESYEHQLVGCYGVFSVQAFWETGIEGEIRQGTALADAAMARGVRHFVYSSVGGAERETGVPHFESKWTVEQHIRDIGLPYTILRPVFFMENWQSYLHEPILNGILPLPLDPGVPLQMIAVDDIGAFVALAFEHPEKWLGREVEIAGAEMTMPEVAATFARVLGRPVNYIQVPWDQFREQAGEEMTIMYRWFDEQGYRANIDALRREYPHLHSLEQVIQHQDWRMRMTA